MDEGKGGQTRSLQEREGGNRKQSANLGENGRKRKNGISRARAILGKKVMGRERGKGEEWGGQKAHDGGLGDGVAEASRAFSEVVVAVLSASRGIHERVQALLS